MDGSHRRGRMAVPRIAIAYRLPAGALAMLVALGLGCLGQWGLDGGLPAPYAWGLLLAGAVSFTLLARAEGLERPRDAPAAGVDAPRLALLVASLALLLLAFPGFAGNRFRLPATVAWLCGLLLLYRAFCGCHADADADGAVARERISSPWPRPGSRQGVREALSLLGILLVALVLRLYRLDGIPAEMGCDMPLIYENAREILQGQLMIFCPRYPGREALYHYLLAAYGVAFGLSHFGIKFTSAMVGLASIAALYGLGRYLYGHQVGLLAAALLALSKWHVILSRSGYRASLMPLMVAGVMFLLLRALRRSRAGDWVVAGMALGLGLYTYNAFMIVPAVVAVALAFELARQGRGALRRQGWGLLGFGLGALGVFLPLGRYVLDAPESYFFRVATRVTSIETALPQNPLRVLLGNLVRTAGMFNLHGDVVSYQNVPGQRELGLVSGALFLFGLGYALFRMRRGHNATVLVFLGGLLLPTALSVAFPREVPNAVRASGALVPVYLLAALPMAALLRRLQGGWPEGWADGKREGDGGSGRRGSREPCAVGAVAAWRQRAGRLLRSGRAGGAVGLAVAVALLGVELAETRHNYFEEYVRHLPGCNYPISLEIARTIDSFAGKGPAYIKMWPHWYDGNALRVQIAVMPSDSYHEVAELDPDRAPLRGQEPRLLVIVHPEDREALRALRARFPRGVAVVHHDYCGRPAFVSFYGER